MYRGVQVSAILPAYNEATRIKSTIIEVNQYVDETIVIDDCSRDATAMEAKLAGAKVFRQEYHQGYLAAIKRGFANASGEIVITIDADGEFPAELIPNLVTPIINGDADMVQGKRTKAPRLSEQILTWLASLRGAVGDSGTGFRALRSSLAIRLQLRGVCPCGIFSLEVLSLGGYIIDVPIKLSPINKKRRIAWYHIRQMFYLLPWIVKEIKTEDKQKKT